jgi:hypothetical protein
MMNRIVQLAASALAWVALALSPSAFGQGVTNTTITAAISAQSGAINAVFLWTEDTIGPGTILVGTFSGCTLVPPPTMANCNPSGGSGTPGDPYVCSGYPYPPPLAGCSGGTPFEVLAGTNNINVRTHTVIAAATTAAQPVPLGPWVPLGSAAGVLLVALRLRRRRPG